MDSLIIALLGLALGVVLTGGVWYFFRSRKGGKVSTVAVYSSIEELRSVGELVVFKIVTKEIVTAAEHWFGEMGRKYFSWLVSTKKMAMIFEFDIDFKYDLRSPEFVIEQQGDGSYLFKMPKCFYETHIRDINFYDEQNTKFLPWLLPDLLNKAFGMGFDEADRNRLKEEAKQQASRLAKAVVDKMRSEVQVSARQTLEVLARGLGAKQVAIDFTHAELVQTRVDTKAIDTERRDSK
jgi:hypothetical protein